MNCVIMMGLPGAGKTTYCAKYLENYYRLSADDLHVDADGEYHYRPELAPEAHRAIKREFTLWACGEGPMKHVVVDNTNLAIHDLAFYIETGLAFKHTVQVIYVYSTGSFSRQVHGVPLDVWQEMQKCAKSTILSWPAHWPKSTVVET